jgi:anti-sigma factor (TIGR02949 family)
LTCQELVEAITEYLEGAMGTEDRRRFNAHLAECPHCVHYLEQMRSTVAALGRVPPESMAPELRDRLLDAFRGWHERKVAADEIDKAEGAIQ